MKSRSSNKFITILAVLAALLCITAAWNWNAPAFAEETDAALDVYADEQLLASFAMEDLEQIAADEGSKKYTYSCFNTYPTPAKFSDVEGPTVEGILEAALGESLDSIGDGQLITFSAPDGVEESLLKEQLFADRYFFPNFEKVVEKKGQMVIGYRGGAVSEDALTGQVKVPAVISLKEDGAAYGEEGNYDVGKLLFGQISPTEQNHSVFVKYLATGDKANAGARGRITIHSLEKYPTQTWNSIPEADAEAAVFIGDAITFDRSVNKSHTEGGSRYWIHYTEDGSTPGRLSQMYNYNNNSFGAAGEKINKPQVSAPGEIVLRTVVTGYGKRDSAVTELRFRGYEPVDVTIRGAKAATVFDGKEHEAAGFTWESTLPEQTTVSERQPARVAGKEIGEYPMGLEAAMFDIRFDGETYHLRDLTIEDGALTVTRPKLAKPSLKPLKVKGKSIILKWGAVSGATGYKIYRATKKTGKYKLVKTITKGKTVSFRNTGLKKKKTYYYKILAYRTVGGKTFNSSWSAVKYKKVK